MTKVDLRFCLQSPLSTAQLERLAEARGVYGVLDIKVDEWPGTLSVEYDASRLNPEEVAAVLHRAGVPAVKEPAT